jgi:hypothetical protein
LSFFSNAYFFERSSSKTQSIDDIGASNFFTNPQQAEQQPLSSRGSSSLKDFDASLS